MKKKIQTAECILRKLYSAILELVFPNRCPMCDKVSDKEVSGFCSECRKKIKYIHDPWCLKCGKQLRDGENEFCRDCKEQNHLFRQGRALYDYSSAAGMLYRFKYKGKRIYGDFLGEELAFFLEDYIREIKPDALIPIPMYPAKKRIRGYNQAEVLADVMGKHLELPVRADLVKRVRNTKPLKGLNPKERLNNLKNAFILVGNGVKLNTIIIVDDIYTTGSTVDAVAKVFLNEGVKNIYFVALAIGEGN